MAKRTLLYPNVNFYKSVLNFSLFLRQFTDLIQLPQYIILPTIYNIIVYWMSGKRSEQNSSTFHLPPAVCRIVSRYFDVSLCDAHLRTPHKRGNFDM